MPPGVYNHSEENDGELPRQFLTVINTWNLEAFEDFFDFVRDIPVFANINRKHSPSRYNLGFLTILSQLAEHPLKPSLCKVRTAISCQLLQKASRESMRITNAHLRAVLDDFDAELAQSYESQIAKDMAVTTPESQLVVALEDTDQSHIPPDRAEASDSMNRHVYKRQMSPEVVDVEKSPSRHLDTLANDPRHHPGVPSGSLDDHHAAVAVEHSEHPDRSEEEHAPKRRCTDLTALRLKLSVKKSELKMAQYELAQVTRERTEYSASATRDAKQFKNDLPQAMEKHPVILTSSFSHYLGYDAQGCIDGLAIECKKYLTLHLSNDRNFRGISKRWKDRAKSVYELETQLWDLDDSISKNQDHGIGA
ncbi:uncharacterized protein F5Z01DRAFT_647028 [Emericellopsis atlantica]|uniref:Uncharacterized protein n=1 Tax=Emericellopsis atlantica TaxID=2614577 RepID=A0A9P7ZU28_9HYPO|nr:uncharacterized protein F5Z01DRAFT_647028 [Emericellopsis atlantica]KAG9257777.1 hypothetical protein F5Z01DRAFT_647028 [Emericellopsis atlantica]